MVDVYHDRVVTDTAGFPPDLFIETFFAYDFVRIFHEIGEQEEFASRQGDLASILTDPSALLIQERGGLQVKTDQCLELARSDSAGGEAGP